MHIVIAPDSFKGTLSSEQIIQIISAEARLHFPEASITGVPIADGGEGTLQAVPLRVTADFGIFLLRILFLKNKSILCDF